MRRCSPPDRIGLRIYACIAVFSFALPAVFAAGALSATDSIDQLYEKVKKEGGKLTIYAALSARSMEIILPAFLKRFPAVTLDHIDATADQLLARIAAEARGGRVIGDVLAAPCLTWRRSATRSCLLRWRLRKLPLTQRT
jgi:ABC-type glycerol-3-phosphate transport system substrate-binding protein